jgi:hypothetical protein
VAFEIAFEVWILIWKVLMKVGLEAEYASARHVIGGSKKVEPF